MKAEADRTLGKFRVNPEWSELTPVTVLFVVFRRFQTNSLASIAGSSCEINQVCKQPRIQILSCNLTCEAIFWSLHLSHSFSSDYGVYLLTVKSNAPITQSLLQDPGAWIIQLGEHFSNITHL